MATKYAVASGDWSATATWSDTDGGAGGATVPADGDTVFISAAVNVKMDVDQSSFTGLATVTVRGGATPGMLYWSDGDSGYLKIRTGNTIVGTTSTNRGRILANSDGSWTTATALSNTYKAVILLEGTSYIDCANLDVKMYSSNPTHASVRTYGTKYDVTAGAGTVSVANDTIDLGTTPPAEGTAVMITTASGTLPGGFVEEYIYYVRAISGNTCKLALQNNDSTIVDITSTGSGTVSVITGHTNTSTAEMNVLEDVTGEAQWSTTAGHNRAVLVDYSQDISNNSDIQIVTLSGITSGTITISENVNSAQYPGARIWLSTRNVSIRSSHNSTSANIITNGTGCIFGEIVATASTTANQYMRGIAGGTNHTVTTIAGCYYGISGSINHTVTTITGKAYSFRSNGFLTVWVPKNNNIGTPPTWYDRNTAYYRGRVYVDHYNGLDAQAIFDMWGDIFRTTCDGAGDAPSVDPDAGNGDCLEASNIQSNISSVNYLRILENQKIWLTAGTHTITYKIQTTYAGITAGNLKLSCVYIGTDGALVTETNAPAISQRSDDTDWSQTLAVTITTTADGFVKNSIDLYEYEANNEVYIWPEPTLS